MGPERKLAFILEEREASGLKSLWILMCEGGVINHASLADPVLTLKVLHPRKLFSPQAKQDCATQHPMWRYWGDPVWEPSAHTEAGRSRKAIIGAPLDNCYWLGGVDDHSEGHSSA